MKLTDLWKEWLDTKKEEDEFEVVPIEKLSEGAIEKMRAIIAEDLGVSPTAVGFGKFEVEEKTVDKIQKDLEKNVARLIDSCKKRFPAECANCVEHCLQVIALYLHKKTADKLEDDKTVTDRSEFLYTRTLGVLKKYICISRESQLKRSIVKLANPEKVKDRLHKADTEMYEGMERIIKSEIQEGVLHRGDAICIKIMTMLLHVLGNGCVNDCQAMCMCLIKILETPM